tara:strand:- start:82 stop:429 length:348 start_codon:yes stop_codon:yes gene_type:complete
MEIQEYAYIEPIPIDILNYNMYSTNTHTFISINRRWIEMYKMKLMDEENKRAERKREKKEEERKKEKKEKKHMKKEDKEIIDKQNSKKDNNIMEKGAELIQDSLWILSGIVKYQQ